MSQEKIKKLGELASPIIQWLNDNFDPHTVVVIQFDRADVLRAEFGAGIAYFLREKE